MRASGVHPKIRDTCFFLCLAVLSVRPVCFGISYFTCAAQCKKNLVVSKFCFYRTALSPHRNEPTYRKLRRCALFSLCRSLIICGIHDDGDPGVNRQVWSSQGMGGWGFSGVTILSDLPTPLSLVPQRRKSKVFVENSCGT